MESHPYSYGTKLTGLILHLFFTVVLTIAVFLLASMLSKNIFELSDVGTEQFLDSGYYKFYEAYHLLKFSNERQILEKAYQEYLELKKANLWKVQPQAQGKYGKLV